MEEFVSVGLPDKSSRRYLCSKDIPVSIGNTYEHMIQDSGDIVKVKKVLLAS